MPNASVDDTLEGMTVKIKENEPTYSMYCVELQRLTASRRVLRPGVRYATRESGKEGTAGVSHVSRTGEGSSYSTDTGVILHSR